MKALGSHPIKRYEMLGFGEKDTSEEISERRVKRLFLYTERKSEKQVSYVLNVVMKPTWRLLTGGKPGQEPQWKLLEPS